MTEAIDYGRFQERLRAADSTGARWELLRQFQREWGYVEPGGDPVWPREAESSFHAALRELAAEELGDDADDPLADVDLSLPIPQALDEWWDLPFNSFTYRPRLYFTHPVWPPEVRPSPSGFSSDEDGLPEQNPFVAPDADRRVCVFKTEYQMCNEWGYLAAEADQSDPRVVVSTQDGWQLQARSISEFFLQLAVERIPAYYGWSIYLSDKDLENASGIGERLVAAYRPMGLLPWRELMADCVVYGAPDAIIHYDRGGHVDFPLMIQARNREALLRTARTLGVKATDDVIQPPRSDEDDPEDGADE
ncbi:MAG: hypothetical protein IRY90_06200 [Actinomadura rubrobrunea]|nr:hypothetical protein [Actinomadura rubrobrunea]